MELHVNQYAPKAVSWGLASDKLFSWTLLTKISIHCVLQNCTAPDTCTCFDGYKLSEESNFTCEPICHDECINGRCTSPNECTCDDGYEKKNSTDDDSKCIVICECENGYCNELNSTCEICKVSRYLLEKSAIKFEILWDFNLIPFREKISNWNS